MGSLPSGRAWWRVYPFGSTIDQGKKGYTQSCAACMILGFLVTILLAGMLNQAGSDSQAETLQSECNLRAQALASALSSHLRASEALAELISSQPSLDEVLFQQLAGSVYVASPILITLYSKLAVHSDRGRIERELGTAFWSVDSGTGAAGKKNVPVEAQYGPVTMSARFSGSTGFEVSNWTGFNVPANVLRAACENTSAVVGESRSLGTSTLLPVYLPVYTASTVPNTAASCSGVLVSIFNMTAVVSGVLDQHGVKGSAFVSVREATVQSETIDTSGFAAWGVPTNGGRVFAQNGFESGAHMKEEVVAFELGQRRFELCCRKRPTSWLVNPWEGGSTAVTATGVLVTLIAMVLGLWRLEEMQKNVDRVKDLNEELRTAKAQAESARAEAEAADLAKSNFLATMSHEIRTPLSGVLGMISLLNETPLDAVQQDYVQSAQASGQGLSGIINDVLDFCKIEAGHMDIENIPYNVRKEMEVVATLFSDKARQKRLDLVFLVQDEVPQMLMGDPNRIRQALVNLVGNAIKFTSKGGIFVWVRIDDPPPATAKIPSPEIPGFGGPTGVSWFNLDTLLEAHPGILSFDPRLKNNTLEGVELAGRRARAAVSRAHETGTVNLVFTVEDTGMGIPRSVQHRLFQPFVQADSSHTRKWGGSGIGLCITAKLVKAMGGLMTVASVENRGSRFSFSVHNTVHDKGSREPPPFGPAATGSSTRLRVIVVDSNGVRGSAVACIFAHLGAETIVVESTSKALSRLLPHPLKSPASDTPSGVRKQRCQSLVSPKSPRENRAFEPVREFSPRATGQQRCAPGKSFSDPTGWASDRTGNAQKSEAQASVKETAGRSFQKPTLELPTGPVPGSPVQCSPRLVNGINGTNGFNGTNGINVASATNGRDGTSGVKGPNGMNGITGPNGINGITGVNGNNGTSGTVAELPNGRRLASPRASTSSTNKPRTVLVVVNWDAIGALDTVRLLRTLREASDKPTPVLAVTARVKDGARDDALKAGCADVLAWPLRELPVVNAVQKALGGEVISKRRAVAVVKYLEGRRALVVDDNQINRKLAGRILEGQGCRVQFASSGAESLERVRGAHDAGEDFDLVLMDLQMPEMDGYEAVQRIRAMEATWLDEEYGETEDGKENVIGGKAASGSSSPRKASMVGDNFAPHTKVFSSLVSGQGGPFLLKQKKPRKMGIVAVSADVKKGVKERCKEVGMTEYISKPFEQKRLREVLVAVLEAESA